MICLHVNWKAYLYYKDHTVWFSVCVTSKKCNTQSHNCTKRDCCSFNL